MLRAALRDLQWRWKRFAIAMRGVALVFAMGLIMTGLDASFTREVSRTLDAIGAERWAVASDAAGPFSTFSPIAANSATDVGGTPTMILRETIQDGSTVRDLIVMGVVPGRLGGFQLPTRSIKGILRYLTADQFVQRSASAHGTTVVQGADMEVSTAP